MRRAKDTAFGVIAPTRRRDTLVTCATILFAITPFTRGQGMPDDVRERVKLATVMVRTSYSENSEGDTLFGTGSGFFINNTGLCVSNNHVVDPGHQKPEAEKFRLKTTLNRLVWTVVTQSGTEDEKEWRADVLYQNEQADLSILQAYDEDGQFLETPDYLTFFPTSRVAKNHKTWCFGFPGGDSRRSSADFPPVAITSGNVVNLPRSGSGRITMIETDVLANPGNSGGPFVDKNGRLVGVLTLGGQTEGRTNTTMLVPGDLVQEFIVTAFKRRKIPTSVHVAPFYDVFAGADGIWELPHIDRPEDQDCVILQGASRICGAIEGDTITWPSPLGELEIPVSAMAYAVIDEDRSMAFLEGGDRFLFYADESSVSFAPEGGEPVNIELANIRAIAFRRPSTPPAVPDRTAIVIGGRDYHLSLLELSGDVKFEESTLGAVMTIDAASVELVETANDERVLYTTTGSRISGEFIEHELTGVLAWSGTPITFTLENADRLDVDRVNYAEVRQLREVELAKSLETSDPRIVRIAKLIDHGDLSEAAPLLDRLLEDQNYRDLSEEKKDQAKFLRGEYLLRSGDLDDAAETFRTLRRAKVNSVQWHSRARLAMIDRYTDGRYEDRKISEDEVFEKAARSLASELAGKAAQGLDGVEKAESEDRSDYLRLLKKSEDVEEQLQIANRLTGGAYEDWLVRLWRVTSRLHLAEVTRLQQQRTDLQEQDTGPGGRELTDQQKRRIERKIEQIGRDIEKAQEDYAAIRVKILTAGFIIDDPDMPS